MLIGLLAYALAITIYEEVFSGLEFIVGLMLVFLGITTILNKKIMRFKHKHPHKHLDGAIHVEEHHHADSEHRHRHKSYVIGLIHGLAGSGSLVALTAATLDNVGMVLGFILLFGIGSMVGMAMIGGLMGFPFALVGRISKIQKIFRYVAGLFSLMIGINIIYTIGIMDNLLGL